MAITVTHPFVSSIPDDSAAAAAGQVVPSNWNATHSISGTLDVANGGTGTTTSTGTGSVVLSTGPTFSPDVVISGSSAGNALRITQTGAGNALLVEDDTNADASPFVVNGAGNVILGHTAQLAGAQYNPSLEVFGSDPSLSGIGQFQYSANTLGSRFQLNKTRGTAPATHTVVQQDDELGAIQFSGSDGTNYIRGANISALVDGTPGTNDMPGRLVFSTTADGASSPTERMRIDSAGNVGIGATPSAGRNFTVSSNITGSTTSLSIFNNGTIQSDVTTSARYYQSSASTAAAAFTLAEINHYLANQGTFGVSSTVTSQFGFVANSSLTGATNNFGFYSDIAASGTSRYNFYAAGTAPNYFGGNTIVSVTDNTNAALRVTQLGTANALEIEDSTNPDATPFIVDASGRLIQGYTTAVASKILTTATTPQWQVHTVIPANYSWTNNATFPGFFLFNKSKSGVVGTLSAVTDGDNLGIIQFNGADNDATSTFNPAAYISAQVAGTVASTSIPGRLNFATTAAAGTSPTVRVSITPEGYLGVGATPTSAQQLLDLRGTNNGLTSDTAVNTLRFTDTDTTTAANQPIGKIEFYNSDTGNAAVGAYILSSAVGTSGGGTIRFGAAADAGAVAEIARVASTGVTIANSVSIGTAGTVTGSVALNGSTSGTVTVNTAAAAGTWTLTLPTSAGTNGYVLSTNGAGVTSWVAQSGGGGGGATAGDNIFLANNFGGF